MFSDLFRAVKTSFIFTFIKKSKPWGRLTPALSAAPAGDGFPTSSCSATMALPCRDSATLLGRFASPSLGEATRPGGCPS